MYKKNKIYFPLIIITIISCRPSYNNNETGERILVETVNDEFNALENIIEMTKVIELSNVTPLANIRRLLIHNERIYILDSQSSICCYNMVGDLLYTLSKKGRGPGEYEKIVDFTIDREKNELLIYCSRKRMILSYNAKNGIFIEETKIDFAPMSFACCEGSRYFFNPYKLIKSKDFNFSLLKSSKNNKIREKYLPHDPIISTYLHGEGFQSPFYYGDSLLLFKNRFDNKIYKLSKNTPKILYSIELPNFPTLNYWRDQPSMKDIQKKDFPFGINNIYKSNDILYFNYVNQSRKIVPVFYSLSNQKILWNSAITEKEIPIELPFFDGIISGVYKDQFISIVEPSSVIASKNLFNDLSIDSICDVKIMDNPILVFYKKRIYAK